MCIRDRFLDRSSIAMRLEVEIFRQRHVAGPVTVLVHMEPDAHRAKNNVVSCSTRKRQRIGMEEASDQRLGYFVVAGDEPVDKVTRLVVLLDAVGRDKVLSEKGDACLLYTSVARLSALTCI